MINKNISNAVTVVRIVSVIIICKNISHLIREQKHETEHASNSLISK